MAFAFEVYYEAPENAAREKLLSEQVANFGGKLNFREVTGPTSQTICLTFEFENEKSANKAADSLRLKNEHVEGPFDY